MDAQHQGPFKASDDSNLSNETNRGRQKPHVIN